MACVAKDGAGRNSKMIHRQRVVSLALLFDNVWWDAFMGSVPVATLEPSWPACWHRESGGEINLDDNFALSS